MSEQIKPIPLRPRDAATAEVSIDAATELQTGREKVDPARALAEALDRELEGLSAGVHTLVRRMYARWGRTDGREAVADRAREVLQEALRRLWEHADEYDPGRRVRPWAMRFANFVLQEQERAEWQHHRDRSELTREREAEERTSASTMLDRLHDPSPVLQQEVRELLALVSAEDAALVREAYLEDASRGEMAAKRGTTAGALRVRLLRAVARLREANQRATKFDS